MSGDDTLHTTDAAALNRLAAQIDGYQTTALLHAAVQLDLPDRIADSGTDLATLAAGCGVALEPLLRLLRALAALALCRIAADGRITPTPAGVALRRNSDSGLRQRLLLGVGHYAPVWARLAEAIPAHERPLFDRLHDQTPWQYRQSQPEIGALFNDWLRLETGRSARALAPALALAGDERVVDVGGGTGALLEALLALHPALDATLFDQPHVVAEAETRWRQASPGARRPRTCGGDFLQPIPLQADVLLLKSVLHDWPDRVCLQILGRCRAALAANGRLLLIERLLPDDPATDPDGTTRLDLHMLLVTGGRERSLETYRHLAEAAGFVLHAVAPTATPFAILDLRPERAAG